MKPVRRSDYPSGQEGTIDYLIDRLLEYGDMQDDAGFRSTNQIAMMMDYGGLAPRGSGMDSSNMASINAIARLRDMPLAVRKAVLMLQGLSNNRERPYLHVVIEEARRTGDGRSIEAAAMSLGIDRKKYTRCLDKARPILAANLSLVNHTVELMKAS